MRRTAHPLLVLAWALALAAMPAAATSPRVVSLNPSLTAILLALDARETLVGIDSFSHRQHPELADLADVGGLFDPGLETIVALRPDVVVLVPSEEQRPLRERLEALGVRVVAFENIRFADVLANIEGLGRLVGRAAAARARVAAIVAERERVERAAAARPRVDCVVVLQRDPLYVVGAGSFLDEMLAAAGCENRGRELGEAYPRAGLEWLVDRAPEVLLDMSPDAAGEGDVRHYWQRWPTLPAVRRERVLFVAPQLVTMPGPYLDEALRRLDRALRSAAASPDGGESR